MTNYDFWQKWKNKSKIEKQAIKSIIKARELIIKSIPKNKLLAIYVKGSFIRREMKKGSDVDIVPIVTENKYEGPVFETNIPKVHPCIIVPLSLWEFKHNELFTKSDQKTDLRAKPDRFIKKLGYYKLIYGKQLNTKGFKIRSDEEVFKSLLKILQNVLIPMYEQGKARLSWVIKEFFWLTEDELILRGIKVEHSFKSIKNSVKDKNHPIKDAYKFRKKLLNGEIKEKIFINKLKKHLNKLEKEML